MPGTKGRSLDPVRPWPTQRQASHRLIWLVVIVTVMEFALNGIQNILEPIPALVAWIAAGTCVAVATWRIESYFARRRRFQEP